MTLLALLQAVVLGLVEGATEFIPVSSTGHLIVVGDWLGFVGERAKTFEIFIQLGAILAVVWVYRARLWRLAGGLGADPKSRRFAAHLLIAFTPAAAVGFLTHDWIKATLFNPLTVAVALVLGGVAIFLVERWRPRTTVERIEDLTPRTALGIGLAQVLALIPGTSRSGATIMGAYALGLSRTAATEFSFFLAIPVMLAATVFDLVDSLGVLTRADVPVFASGFVVAFVSAMVIVRAFLGYVARHSFTVFAWYRIAFGLLLLGYYGLVRG
ncbi:MAG TPA: undecaprenyl-diphosphate phosphatase [Gemmatimonadales bacterium]|nr:undecaprenyl-diphosphate phosphatase [Gemmatimonadales bacterium]